MELCVTLLVKQTLYSDLNNNLYRWQQITVKYDQCRHLLHKLS